MTAWNVQDYTTDALKEDRAASWKEAARRLKDAEAEEKQARQDLLEACDGENYEGAGVAVKQVERKGSVEYTAIPELADVNLEQYRKKGTVYWTVKPSLKE